MKRTGTVAVINIDESPCAIEDTDETGNIENYIDYRLRLESFYAIFKTNNIRPYHTFVCMICNIDAVHRALPQIMLLHSQNSEGFVVEGLRATLTLNFHSIDSGQHWMNQALLYKIFCIITVSLGLLF
jgi:hypothetical protein